MLLFLVSTPVFAHGPPAAVTGVASADVAGPVHVTLTEGLAVHGDDGAWRFVCPASWGSTPIDPTAAALVPDEVWLPGADGLYVAGLAGDVAEAAPAPAIGSLLAFGRSDDAIVALTVGPDATRTVWDVAAGGAALWTGEDPITGLAPWDGGSQLVGVVGGELWSIVLDGEGTEVAREVVGPAQSSNPALRATPSALYLVERSAGSEALTRWSDRVPLGPVVAEVLGPVEVGATTFVALDGRLHAIDGDTVVPAPDDRAVTCLAAIGDAAWGCVDDGWLAPLDASGSFGAPIVGPASVGAPDFTLVDPADLDLCFSQWRVWATDAGVDPGFPPEPPPADAEHEPLEIDHACGCRTPGGGGAVIVGFFAWWPVRGGRLRKQRATALTR